MSAADTNQVPTDDANPGRTESTGILSSQRMQREEPRGGSHGRKRERFIDRLW